ncbi:MAG: hypothetical protein QOF61_1976, partial [Acidobacteriota bacterium]|nr:hypothetical protein [Acidobacteriota bacterium]
MSLQVFIDGLLHYAGLTLVHGTVLALLTWLLSATLLRRSRPAIQAVLWTIVLVKFFLPPILPGEMALSGRVAQAATRIAARERAIAEPSSGSNTERQSTHDGQPVLLEAPGTSPAHTLFICYLFLVILLGGRALRALRRTGRRIRALRLGDRSTNEEVMALAGRIGLKHAPDVRVSDAEMTPYVFGLRRPVLVLPERLMGMLEPAERRALILHELAHVRRKDVLIRWLQSLAGIFFFFFPPVLWVCRRVEHFTEMACDHWAVVVSEVEPCSYASVLVKVVSEMSHAPQPQAGLPLVRGMRLLEKRLRAVLRDEVGTSPRLPRTAKIVLTCWSLFVLMGGSAANVAQQTSPPTEAAANKAEGSSSQRIPGKKNESQAMMPRRHFKETVERHISSGQSQKSVPPADQLELNRNKSFASGALSSPETRAVESGFQQGTTAPSTSKKLSPYEEGYLLGRRYAQENGDRSQMSAKT